MLISKELGYRHMTETVHMLLRVIEMVSQALGIKFEFFNIGGGVGIPYRPEDEAFDMPALARESRLLLQEFQRRNGYAPRLFMECARFMTGPYGALVATVINRMSKYREYVGVNASTLSANPRPAVYQTAYQHITILDTDGRQKQGDETVVDIVGPLCENNDKYAQERLLPGVEVGDTVVQHDSGAHYLAMGGNYNGWLRPQELLLHPDGTVELIRRAEAIDDLFASLTFEPSIMSRT